MSDLFPENTVYLPSTHETSRQLAGDIIRLAPHLERSDIPGLVNEGVYLRTIGGLDLAIKASIVDTHVTSEPRPGLPQFELGLSINLFDDQPEGTVHRILERVTVAGSQFEDRIAASLRLKRVASRGNYGFTVTAQQGEQEVFNTKDPAFEGRFSVNALIKSLYLRYPIATLDPRYPDGEPVVEPEPEPAPEIETRQQRELITILDGPDTEVVREWTNVPQIVDLAQEGDYEPTESDAPNDSWR